MPFSIEQKRIGFKKEATRLTAETTPTIWNAFDPESELDVISKLIEDSATRGIKASYPPLAGPLDIAGKISGPVRAQNIGELLQMLLGDAVSVQQGATAAYKHTWNNPTTIQIPTFTLFMDRSLSVKKYNGCGVKKIALTQPVDGALTIDAEVLGLAEAAGSIGVPTFTESGILTHKDCTVKIAGSTDNNVKSWVLNIDNGMLLKRSMNQSQAPQDIITPGRMVVDGTFLIYFENETERDKFVANTTTTLQFLIEGAIIASTFKYTVDVNVYDVRYTAFPWGAEEGLLAAAVTWTGYYSTGSSKLLQVDLTNINTTQA